MTTQINAAISGFPPVDVAINGATLATTGTKKVYPMLPTVQASANFANIKECWVGTCKAWRIRAPINPTSGEAIIGCSSTVANDQAAVKAVIDAITTTTTGEWDAPAGTGFSGVTVLGSGDQASDWTFWDGVTTIKTIGLELTAAILNETCILETIE